VSPQCQPQTAHLGDCGHMWPWAAQLSTSGWSWPERKRNVVPMWAHMSGPRQYSVITPCSLLIIKDYVDLDPMQQASLET
jgi:hypothetical protein